MHRDTQFSLVKFNNEALGNLELNSHFVTQSVDELNIPDLNFLICKRGRIAIAKNEGAHVSG